MREQIINLRRRLADWIAPCLIIEPVGGIERFVSVRVFMPQGMDPVVVTWDREDKEQMEKWSENQRWYPSQIIGYCAERVLHKDEVDHLEWLQNRSKRMVS